MTVLSSVGVGTWAMGGAWRMGWGAVDDAESVRALEAAFDAGVSWVDTAPLYGDGRAESVVGRAVAHRDEVLVLTKCGLSDGGIDQRPESVRRSVHASLRRLGRSWLDAVQVHWPDPCVSIEETWGELAALRQEGLVRWAGISNHPLELVERAHRVAPVDVVQLRLSMLDTRGLEDLVPWCEAHGARALAYSPLASGLLGAPLQVEDLAADDWRRSDERFLAEARMAPPVRQVIQSVALTNTARAALAWLVAQPGVSGAIVGIRTASEGRDLAEVMRTVLSSDALVALTAVASDIGRASRPGLR